MIHICALQCIHKPEHAGGKPTEKHVYQVPVAKTQAFQKAGKPYGVVLTPGRGTKRREVAGSNQGPATNQFTTN
jgi:hypothetical protein